MNNIGIIGSGSFGCALANVLIKNHNVKIWSFKKEEADVINNGHRCMFIDNSKLDERIVCYTNYEDVIDDSEYLILVTPSSVIRNICKNIKEYVKNQKIIIASKGMEIGTNKFLTDIVKEELDLKYIGVISGPSIAKEVINVAVAVLGYICIEVILGDLFEAPWQLILVNIFYIYIFEKILQVIFAKERHLVLPFCLYKRFSTYSASLL